MSCTALGPTTDGSTGSWLASGTGEERNGLERKGEERNGATSEEREGAVLEVHPDGSVTLYGLDDHTEVGDEPVVAFGPVKPTPPRS